MGVTASDESVVGTSGIDVGVAEGEIFGVNKVGVIIVVDDGEGIELSTIGVVPQPLINRNKNIIKTEKRSRDKRNLYLLHIIAISSFPVTFVIVYQM